MLMDIQYYVHYHLLQLSLYKIKSNDLSFFFQIIRNLHSFLLLLRAMPLHSTHCERKTEIILSDSAIDIISLLTQFALYFLDSFKHHLSPRKTNQRMHDELAQVPFMTEGKVQILVSVSF